MMFRAAIALVALAMPAFAQHGGTHAGSFGNRGFSRAGGFSSHPSFSHPVFSQSPSFARPAQPARYPTSYGRSPGTGFRGTGQPNYLNRRAPYNGSSSLRTPYNGNRYNGNRFVAGSPTPGRSPIDPRRAGLSRGRDRDQDRDRDRFDARRRQFQGWYGNTYPNWPGYGNGYPFLIDPNSYNLGLYDWGDSDNSESDSSQPGSYEPGSYEPDQAPGSSVPGSYEPGSYVSDQSGPAPLYPPPYPGEGYGPPSPQLAAAAPSAPSASAQPLTVIFKSGRAPIEVENYLMTAKVLTDLDSEHYEQIPLDQIDLAATRRFNSFAGVEFQVPAASRN
jgi:hypothetical protein